MYLYRQYINAFTASQAGTLIILVFQAETKQYSRTLWDKTQGATKNKNINFLLFYNAILYFLYVVNNQEKQWMGCYF